MSTQVFPSFNGLAFPVVRTPNFRTRKQVAIAGMETTIADMPYPRYTWEVIYNVLRQGSSLYAAGDSFTEWATLMGFFNSRNGGADSFLYQDDDDKTAPTDSPIQNTVTGSNTGDGATLVFQLQRALGGFVEPIFAPNVVTNVKVNGGVVSGANYTTTLWETGNANGPGKIVFNGGSAPGNGLSVTATFTYYWPARFMSDQCQFEKFMSNRWRVKKLAWESLVL